MTWPGGKTRQHDTLAVDGFIDLGTPGSEGVALAGLGRCHEADSDTAAPRARAARSRAGDGGAGALTKYRKF